MRTTVLILLMIMSFCLVSAADAIENDRPDQIAPDFVTSFYDHYTVNLLNARTLGMGGTTVALQGGIENALVNPAAFKGGAFQLYFEGVVKSSVDEMNQYAAYVENEEGEINYSDYELVNESQKLETGIPGGIFGFGFSLHPNISAGASISVPQSVRYNLLGRSLPTGEFVDRFPAMNNFQTTLTLAGHYEQFNLGLNIVYNYYTFKDLRLIAPHFDRVSYQQGVLRFQPGFLFTHEQFSVGLSYKFAAEEEFKMGNSEPYYEIYETTFPSALDAGLSYRYSDDVIIALAFEYQQMSQQYDGFSDLLTMKLGFEKSFDNYDIRGGLISRPGIYTGSFAIPKDAITEGDFLFDPLPYDFGIVQKSDQLLITGGFSYYLRDVDLTLAFAKDVLQNLDLFQIAMSVNVKLGEIIARGPNQ